MSDSPDNTPEPETSDGARHSSTNRNYHRLRLIRRALTRLGLLDLLGRDWVNLDPGTGRITFNDVPRHRSQEFLLLLQDLGDEMYDMVVATDLRPVDAIAMSPVGEPFFPSRTTTGPHLGGRR